MANLDQLNGELIFKAGSICQYIGLSRSMGQLYAALYLSGRPVSLDDLAKMCGMSKGNASINIRRLEKWDAVRRARSNGGRKDYYEANKDIIGFGLSHGLNLFAEVMEKGRSVLSDAGVRLDELEKSERSPEKLAELANYRKSLQELERLSKKVKGLASNIKKLKGLIG